MSRQAASGANALYGSANAYGQAVGFHIAQISLTNDCALGVTTDPTKSGLIGDIETLYDTPIYIIKY